MNSGSSLLSPVGAQKNHCPRPGESDDLPEGKASRSYTARVGLFLEAAAAEAACESRLDDLRSNVCMNFIYAAASAGICLPAGRPAQVLLIFRRDLCIPASTATAGQADLTSGQWSRPDPLPTGQRLFSVIVNEYSPAVFAVAGSKRASNGE